MLDQILESIIGLFIFSIFYWLLIKTVSYVFDISLRKATKYISIAFGSILVITSIWIFAPRVIKRVQNPRYELSNLVKIGPAPSFELTDQNNKKVSNATYQGKVYVVEFFFSTCPSICPIMNRNMAEIQNKFFGNPNFGIASITINPEYDTAGVLKEHADLIGVKSSNWHMLTGDKDYIFNLANKGFNLYTGENKKASGGFEHSGLFALIDKEGNIRCRKDKFGNPILYYDGLEKEGVKAITEDIKKLLNE